MSREQDDPLDRINSLIIEALKEEFPDASDKQIYSATDRINDIRKLEFICLFGRQGIVSADPPTQDESESSNEAEKLVDRFIQNVVKHNLVNKYGITSDDNVNSTLEDGNNDGQAATNSCTSSQIPDAGQGLSSKSQNDNQVTKKLKSPLIIDDNPCTSSQMPDAGQGLSSKSQNDNQITKNLNSPATIDDNSCTSSQMPDAGQGLSSKIQNNNQITKNLNSPATIENNSSIIPPTLKRTLEHETCDTSEHETRQKLNFFKKSNVSKKHFTSNEAKSAAVPMIQNSMIQSLPTQPQTIQSTQTLTIPPLPVQISPIQPPTVQSLVNQRLPVQTSSIQPLPIQTSPIRSPAVQTLANQRLPVQSTPIQSLPVQISPIHPPRPPHSILANNNSISLNFTNGQFTVNQSLTPMVRQQLYVPNQRFPNSQPMNQFTNPLTPNQLVSSTNSVPASICSVSASSNMRIPLITVKSSLPSETNKNSHVYSSISQISPQLLSQTKTYMKIKVPVTNQSSSSTTDSIRSSHNGENHIDQSDDQIDPRTSTLIAEKDEKPTIEELVKKATHLRESFFNHETECLKFKHISERPQIKKLKIRLSATGETQNTTLRTTEEILQQNQQVVTSGVKFGRFKEKILPDRKNICLVVSPQIGLNGKPMVPDGWRPRDTPLERFSLFDYIKQEPRDSIKIVNDDTIQNISTQNSNRSNQTQPQPAKHSIQKNYYDPKNVGKMVKDIYINCLYSECGVTLAGYPELNKHLQRNHSHKFKCEACPETFEKISCLQRHQSEVHKCSSCLRCASCTSVFKTISLLRFHNRNIHLKGMYKCGFDEEDCHFKAEYRYMVIEHYENEHTNIDWHCSFENCDERFITQKQMEDHEKQVHLDNRKPFKCIWKKCSYGNISLRNTRKHVCIEHYKYDYDKLRIDMKSKTNRFNPDDFIRLLCKDGRLIASRFYNHI